MGRDTQIEISFSAIEVTNLILTTFGVESIMVTLQNRDQQTSEVYYETEFAGKKHDYPPPMDYM